MQRKKYISTPRVRKYRHKHRRRYNYSNRKSDAKWFVRHANLEDLKKMADLMNMELKQRKRD